MTISLVAPDRVAEPVIGRAFARRVGSRWRQCQPFAGV